MLTLKRTFGPGALALLLLLLLAACAAPAPIPLYVTPTPLTTAVGMVPSLPATTPAPSATPLPGTLTPTPTVDPAVTFGPVVLPTQVTPTRTPQQIGAAPATVTPTLAFGPITTGQATPTPAAPGEVVPTGTGEVGAAATPTASPVAPLAPTATATAPVTATTGSFGPIVPPNYTLPPSPTRTPPPTLTPTPSSTAAPPTPTTIPLPALNAEQIGIQLHPDLSQDQWNDMLNRIVQLNVGWVKVQFAWRELEPGQPGNYARRLDLLEGYLRQASEAGLHVMVSIAKAPPWARASQEEDGPPQDPQDFARFVRAILDRDGTYIDAIEIWNEPNLRREWNGAPISGTQYMALFAPAYQAIKDWSAANNHPIQIVTAGLAPAGDSPFSVDDRQYLRQMYRAGLANYPDVIIGMHPYAWGNAPETRCCNPVPDRAWDDSTHFFFLENIESYHDISRENGHNVPLWATEFGWPTYDGFGYVAPQGFFDYVTEALQASYTIHALDLVQNSGQYPYVGVMLLWNLNFATIPGLVPSGNEMAGYSLLRPDGSERPLFHYLRDSLN